MTRCRRRGEFIRAVCVAGRRRCGRVSRDGPVGLRQSHARCPDRRRPGAPYNPTFLAAPAHTSRQTCTCARGTAQTARRRGRAGARKPRSEPGSPTAVVRGGVSAGRARVASAPHTTVTTASSPSPPPSPQHQPRALPRLRPVKEVPAGGARGSAQRESAVHDGAGARVAATSRLVREDIGGRAVDHHEAEARAPVGRGHGSG